MGMEAAKFVRNICCQNAMTLGILGLQDLRSKKLCNRIIENEPKPSS